MDNLDVYFNRDITVLSIDPGIAKIGLSCIRFPINETSPEMISNNNSSKKSSSSSIEKGKIKEEQMSVDWMCLLNISSAFKGEDNIGKSDKSEIIYTKKYKRINLVDKETNKDDKSLSNEEEVNKIKDSYATYALDRRCDKYPELSEQLNRLNRFLNSNENFQNVLKIPGLIVCIEQTEGVRDVNILFRLMRINLLSGYICNFLHSKGIKVFFVPKTYKAGWNYLRTIAKEKLDNMIKEQKKTTTKNPLQTTNFKRHNKKPKPCLTENKKKALMKTFRKDAVCSLVKMVIKKGPSPKEVKQLAARCSNVDFNHMADSASQAMRFIKENFYKTNNGKLMGKNSPIIAKQNRDILSNELKELILNDFNKQ